MTTIAELGLPAESFALDEAFGQCPDLTVDVLQGVAHNTTGLSNLVWVETDDLDAADAALKEDATVTDVEELGDIDGKWLYTVGWKTPVSVALAVLLEDATMLGATGDGDGWSFRVLFPKRNALSIAASVFEQYDVNLRIERIYELGTGGEHGEYDLTDEQREALEAALENGYFKVPRDTTLGSIADDLGISHQALSERLRRANEILAEVAIQPPSASEEAELRTDD
ncbi:helix-turn-helix domain-containing protein [Halomarina oriensis]|uniref:DNA-binding protein n=1 Tax=Halomarina oriensis TaxID=671145 RepID=A0A6B0GKI2_9EURY|nr:helix-turn-helix domain-containing protein [Halomarina oriensis]MWG33929.1 DNA-binding protein [Halomarina oriensis]